MKKFKILVGAGFIVLLCGFVTLNTVFAISNKNFEFRIQPYQNNTTTPYSIYRAVAKENHKVPWLIKMTSSGEGAGTYTTYWLELKNGKNVSPDQDAKIGVRYKPAAFSYANSEYVYLTAENNNNNSVMYTVKGYWNAKSSY